MTMGLVEIKTYMDSKQLSQKTTQIETCDMQHVIYLYGIEYEIIVNYFKTQNLILLMKVKNRT